VHACQQCRISRSHRYTGAKLLRAQIRNEVNIVSSAFQGAIGAQVHNSCVHTPETKSANKNKHPQHIRTTTFFALSFNHPPAISLTSHSCVPSPLEAANHCHLDPNSQSSPAPVKATERSSLGDSNMRGDVCIITFEVVMRGTGGAEDGATVTAAAAAAAVGCGNGGFLGLKYNKIKIDLLFWYDLSFIISLSQRMHTHKTHKVKQNTHATQAHPYNIQPRGGCKLQCRR
jgi:hypothetical protein